MKYRNYVHRDAIERDWPSGPHDSNKKQRSKSERQIVKREIGQFDPFDLYCEYCGRRLCNYDCDMHLDEDMYLDESAWADMCLEMLIDNPQSHKVVEQYLIVDETEN